MAGRTAITLVKTYGYHFDHKTFRYLQTNAAFDTHITTILLYTRLDFVSCVKKLVKLTKTQSICKIEYLRFVNELESSDRICAIQEKRSLPYLPANVQELRSRNATFIYIYIYSKHLAKT